MFLNGDFYHASGKNNSYSLFRFPPSKILCPLDKADLQLKTTVSACATTGAGCFTSSMQCFDTEACSWHTLTPGDMQGTVPSPRGWFAACSAGGKLYVHGGVDGGNSRLADLHELTFD